MTTRLGIGYEVCCNGYIARLRGWLGTTEMVFVLTLVGLCCDAKWVV